MPGFPIRTSSDQRFIDNSPRLNAALHVLHRLSMPRHPPCALNNEHTTNTNNNHHKSSSLIHAGVNYTKHKRTEITQTTHPPPHTQPKGQLKKVMTACGLMLASTIQFSHNTPHRPTTMPIASRLLKKCGLQPGDNAPDTQQCTKYSSNKRVG